MPAYSADLMVLFKDLSRSFKTVFHLLGYQDKEVALVVLRGRFFHLNFNNLPNEHINSSLDEPGVDLNSSNIVTYSEDNTRISNVFRY